MSRKMKDSGIEWIGEIPEDWEIKRVKNIFTYHKDIVGSNESEYERLALTLNGVLKRSKNDNKGLQSESFSTYQILNKKELVFKMIDLENVNTSRVGYSLYTGIVSPVYIILNNEKYTRYGYYFFYSMWQRNIFNMLGNNGVRSSLNASDMLNLPFLNIPAEISQKISDFLDKKIEEINKIIEKTKESIEEYKKYKQIIITETVTKGLNSNVEMKDSGIEWIGEIPKDWECKKVKYIIDSLSKGNGITKEDVKKDGNIQCVRYGEIYSKYDRSFENCISATDIEKISSPRYITKGDILFAATGELVEEIGKNIVFMGNEPCLVGGDIIIMKHSQNPIFLNYAMNSLYSQEQKSKGKIKLKVVHISAADIGNLLVALPPIKEQKQIADFLDEKCNKIDELITKKERIIEELEVYKKSIIYEYVTGKKEV